MLTFGVVCNPLVSVWYTEGLGPFWYTEGLGPFSHAKLWLLSSFWRTTVNFQVFFDVLLAIFLSYMGCEIVLIFNKASPLRNRFESIEEVARALELGQVTGISPNQIWVDFFLNPIGLRGKSVFHDRLIQAAKHNTPIIVPSYDKAIRLVLFDRSRDYIFVSSLQSAFQVLVRYCGISYISVHGVVPSLWYTSYVSNSFRHIVPRDLTEAGRTLVRLEYNRLQVKYHNTKVCPDDVLRSTSPKSLSLSQVQSLFLLYCCAVVGSFVLALTEWMMCYCKAAEILAAKVKDQEEDLEEIFRLIDLVEGTSMCKGLFLSETAKRMVVDRLTALKDNFVNQYLLQESQIHDPQVPDLTFVYSTC